jgi:hypothetical protein
VQLLEPLPDLLPFQLDLLFDLSGCGHKH